MSNKMQEYYLLQAEVLQDVFAGEKDVLHAFSQKHKEASRLCIVGSGSSFYCAQIAAPFIRQNAGIEVLTMLPGRAEEFAPLPEDLMLLVTQEGKSVNVMRVADHLEALGKPFSVLTALTESPTALRAEDCLSMGCGEEKSGPKTKGVTSTLLMLQRLALELGLARGHLTQEAYQQKQEALATDLNAAHSMLEKSLEWVLQNEAFFTQAPFCAIISVAPLCFLAQEAALKLVETLICPQSAMNLRSSSTARTACWVKDSISLRCIMACLMKTGCVRSAPLHARRAAGCWKFQIRQRRISMGCS